LVYSYELGVKLSNDIMVLASLNTWFNENLTLPLLRGGMPVRL